jgi:hypothetical protein
MKNIYFYRYRGESESKIWKWNNSNTRSFATSKISCYKNITIRNREQIQPVSKIWLDDGPHCNRMPNVCKRTIYTETGQSVCSSTL